MSCLNVVHSKGTYYVRRRAASGQGSRVRRCMPMPPSQGFVEALRSAWREHTGESVADEEASAMASRLTGYLDLLLRAPVENADLTRCHEERDDSERKT